TEVVGERTNNEPCAYTTTNITAMCNSTKKLYCSTLYTLPLCRCPVSKTFDPIKETCVSSIGTDYSWLDRYSNSFTNAKCSDEDDCPFNAKCVPYKEAVSLRSYSYCKCR